MREKRAFDGVYCNYPPPSQFVCLNSVKDGVSRTFASVAFRLRNVPVPCGFAWTRRNLGRNIPVAVRRGRRTYEFVRHLSSDFPSLYLRAFPVKGRKRGRGRLCVLEARGGATMSVVCEYVPPIRANLWQGHQDILVSYWVHGNHRQGSREMKTGNQRKEI